MMVRVVPHSLGTVLVAVTMLDASSAQPGAAPKPNFLFMLADDWGWGDVGAYGATGSFSMSGTNTRTPNLDALARNGTLFTDFHTGQSYCAPSRTAFMTGKFPQDLSVNTNWDVGHSDGSPNFQAGLPYQLPTPSGEGPSPWKGGLPNVAATMQKGGYATAHYGKWHLGGCSPNGTHTPYPSEYGFDHTGTYGSPVYGHCSGTPPTAKDEVASKAVAAGQDGPDPWWSSDVGDYIRDRGVAHMTAATKAQKPFYLHLWWHMSHDTIDPRPEQYNVTFPFKETCLFPATSSCQAASGGVGCEPCNWQIFWGVQTYSDTHRFGPVIDAIDALGVRDNTYIIFSTDNGAQAERWTNNQGGSGLNGDTSGAFSNAVGTQGPFRGCKASLYDGGHRVPFIVTGPGVPHGRIDHSLISAVDYFPTISALSGIPIPTGTVLRGSDISDIWHGITNHKTVRPKPLFWRGGGGPPPCWNRSPGLAVRNGDWKLLFNPNEASGPLRVELYNMSIAGLGLGGTNGAFFEAQNEARHYPEVVEAMVKEILPWHRGTPVPFGAPNNTAPDHPRFQPAGCESYPFPGTVNAHGPDDKSTGDGVSSLKETLLVQSNLAGGDAANAAAFAQNLALHYNRGTEGVKPSVPTAAGFSVSSSPLATPEALAMHYAMQGQEPVAPELQRSLPSTESAVHRNQSADTHAQRRRLAELEAEVAALKAKLEQHGVYV